MDVSVTVRVHLVHWNDDYLGIGLTNMRNTRSWIGITIPIYSFGDNTAAIYDYVYLILGKYDGTLMYFS